MGRILQLWRTGPIQLLNRLSRTRRLGRAPKVKGKWRIQRGRNGRAVRRLPPGSAAVAHSGRPATPHGSFRSSSTADRRRAPPSGWPAAASTGRLHPRRTCRASSPFTASSAPSISLAETDDQLAGARMVLLRRRPPPNRRPSNLNLEASTRAIADPAPAQSEEPVESEQISVEVKSGESIQQ